VVYAFRYNSDLILLDADSERDAEMRAFFEVATEYDVDPDRLQELGWPSASDYSQVPLDKPTILQGEG